MMEEPPEFWEDVKWARTHYAQLQELYEGQWVAIFEKEVASHGKSLKKVEEEARKLKGDKYFYTVFVNAGAVVY